MSNLYELPEVTSGLFERQCGGNLESESETCVAIAPLSGVADGFAMRDSKKEGEGRELRFTTAELDAFAVGWVASRGLAA
ncbi:DUF397 domain-containing protein [Kitasatospora sp. A2-31]|uniref:DUF397 domain-containing protein n=1 Tax=Kitasatospora sp. A2-31 TaxID=2916414 RepID=UPI001EEDB3C2|nr:DUF397 domain-containing protein [Kitasatospora sp. A2-31]MCG6499175.1 DUF397 domain-containing protein [Kitasatospora sp. A2-31]